MMTQHEILLSVLLVLTTIALIFRRSIHIVNAPRFVNGNDNSDDWVDVDDDEETTNGETEDA